MLAPVAALADRRRPRLTFALVWLYHSAIGLVPIRWLLHALVVEYQVPVWGAWSFALLLVISYSALPAAATAIYALWRPRIALAAAPVLFSALWTLFEWLRAEPLGLPWVLAAQTLARVPTALQLADLGGVYAVGFALTLVNAGLGLALVHRSAKPLLAPAVAIFLAGLYATWQLAEPVAQGETLRVAVVQAAIPQSERFQPGSALRNTLRHVELTRKLASGWTPDLVVWSETAIDDDLDAVPEISERLSELSDSIDAALVAGAPRSRNGRRSNSVVLFAPRRGLVEAYDKQRLVPFSEYDPTLIAFLDPLLSQLSAGPGYTAGREATVFRSGPIPFSTPVCFEITYPKLVHRFHQRGARLLLNLSNDAWFGQGGYAEMHLGHAVFRAIEGRTWVVRATNTGISAVIDPHGRVVEELPLFREGVIRTEVAARLDPLPLYARLGNVPVLAFLLVMGAAALATRARPAGRGPAPG